MKYRIIRRRNGMYVCQMKAFLLWHDLFCGPVSDLPDEFDSVARAEQAIKDFHVKQGGNLFGTFMPGVVKEFEL